jgi:hypothetical protein
MSDIVQYILGFLLGEGVSPTLLDQIAYTKNAAEFHRYKLVILPSAFFDKGVYATEKSMPQLPLQIWEETPILFGKPAVEIVEGTLVLHADLVASTYFLISRYEEMLRKEIRDVHGRFIGKESLPYRAGFIDSPLVEEYGSLLRSKLRELGLDAPEPPRKIKKVYLTHDLDFLAHYRTIRGFIGGLLRGMRRPKEGRRAIRTFFTGITYDPWYTFPWLFDHNNAVKKVLGADRCESIVFIRTGFGLRKEDQPTLYFQTPDFITFKKLCRKKEVVMGIHTSYAAGIDPKRIKEEVKVLDRLAKKKTLYNRNHFLNSREPWDMQYLLNAGITDDFTMGYADIAGFRLGTCRPVRWINPVLQELTTLTLHPLTVMDGSLSDKRYMFLNAHDAYEYTVRLIDVVEKWNGELVLLWHNTSVTKDPKLYHRALYGKLVEYLKAKV